MTRRSIALVLFLVSVLVGVVTPAAQAEGRRTYTGTIDGADYRVEMPRRWNGTLVLYSHGYIPPDIEFPGGIWVANREETAQWLLDRGYALAASDFKGRTGWVVGDAQRDQIALLDWFDRQIGKPRRTVINGMSMGAGISVLLAERHPRRFAGVLTTCGEYDIHSTLNTQLDMAFTVRTLLGSADIDLVRARDPQASTNALLAAIQEALKTPQGRAKLALAGAFGNLPGWNSVHGAPPAELEGRIRAQAGWLHDAYIWGMGPVSRVDVERRAGGNPSWNTGIDYRRQLAKSAQQDLVREAYREARIDLGADLDRLAAAPRISADPAAVAYMYRTVVPRGTAQVPILSMHNTGDGGAITDQERWLAERVPVRQTWVARGGHCGFSAADEIVALTTLFKRIDTGKWDDTSPRALNARVASFDPKLQTVLDFITGEDKYAPPAFTKFTPPALQRPSR